MKIGYVVDQKLMSNKAHDKLIFNTCYSLASLGHQVVLIMKEQGVTYAELFKYYSLPLTENLKIIPIKIFAYFFFKISWRFSYRFLVLLKLINLSRNGKLDVIYVSEIKLGKLLIRFRNIIGIPVVYEFHGLKAIEKGSLDSDEQYIIKKADGIIVTTFALKNKMISIYYNENALIEVISLASYPYQKQNNAKSYPPSHYKVFYIGSLYPLQGVDILIKSFAYLKNKNTSLHIVGGNKSEIEDLKMIAKESGMEEKIIFYGYIPPIGLHSILSDVDLLVIPSKKEGRMPYVAHTKIYEYLSVGKPIIATDMQSITEVLKDGINAIIVKPNSHKDIAMAIDLIIDNPELCAKISMNALRESLNYTWEKRAKRLLAFFNKVLNE